MDLTRPTRAVAALLVTSTIGFSAPALAVPLAQIDILDGTYCETCDETVVTSETEFTVYTYLRTTDQNTMTDTSRDWYLAIAITPQTESGPIGSFEVDGTSYDSSDLTYGTPPLEDFGELQGHDSGDLSTHSIYDTLFLELRFSFEDAATRSSVNVQDNAGTDPTANPGDDLYYVGFDIDASNLIAGFGLHFDLYNSDISDCGNSVRSDFGGAIPPDCEDIDADDFAPFSHDAGTVEKKPPTEVPEPGTLALFGTALLALAITRRRRKVRI